MDAVHADKWVLAHLKPPPKRGIPSSQLFLCCGIAYYEGITVVGDLRQ